MVADQGDLLAAENGRISDGIADHGDQGVMIGWIGKIGRGGRVLSERQSIGVEQSAGLAGIHIIPADGPEFDACKAGLRR